MIDIQHLRKQSKPNQTNQPTRRKKEITLNSRSGTHTRRKQWFKMFCASIKCPFRQACVPKMRIGSIGMIKIVQNKNFVHWFSQTNAYLCLQLCVYANVIKSNKLFTMTFGVTMGFSEFVDISFFLWQIVDCFAVVWDSISNLWSPSHAFLDQ